ncbi:MAG: hypothetical protein KA319_13330 [Ferruginibacter sp.]|nr:hypothetical protein [Ferruginibacter sp.]
MKLLLNLLLIIAALQSEAQTSFSKYSITTVGQDEGLSQGSNYFRHEDSKGFMWITCADAINRYDGSRVKVYNLNMYFKNCPNLQQGYGFAEDAESNIYVGSERGLYIYNRATDKFTLQKVFTAPDEITMPFAFENNKIWCFNRYYKLATYNVKTKQTIIEANLKLDTIKSIHIYQNNNNIFYFRFPAMDNNGNVWLAGKNKIARYNIATKTTTYPSIGNIEQIYSTVFDTINNIFNIGTSQGLIQYYTTTNKFNSVTNVDSKTLGNVYALAFFKNTIVFNSTAGICIASNNFKSYQWLRLKGDLQSRQTIQYSFDKQGRLWLTDDGKGQKIFSFKEKLFYKIPDDNETYNFIPFSGVGTIAEKPNKDILFVANWALNTKNKSLYDSKFDYNRLGKSYHTITDTKRSGVWYVASIGINNQFIFIDSLNKSNIYTIEGTITGTHQDFLPLSNGQFLLSSSNSLYWFTPKKSSLEIANSKPNPFKINMLSNNRIAVSYLNGSMQLYNHANNAIIPVKEILPSIQSFYLQENSKTKQYWAGTNKGIYLLDENFNEIKHFDANNGLAGTYIYGLLLDDAGNAWASHQHGLSSINATTYQIINYDKSDGIQEWDYNNRAFLKASDGTLYFGGVNGVNYFKPPLKQNIFYQPQVYVDEILVNNISYLPDTSANEIQKINTNFKNNNISIKAYIKDLENAAYEKIVYRINKQGSNWNYADNTALINLTGLEPGIYTVEIGIYNKFTGKETVQKTIEIIVKAPFYKKGWFWILVTALVTSVLLSLFNSRRITMQKRVFAQQQALDEQRQKITADLHDDIGASLSSIQLNSAVANKLIDKDILETKDILVKIETQSKNVSEKIGDFIWSMKPGKDEFISLSGRIKNFANDILGASNINYKITTSKEVDNLLTDFTVRKNILFIAKEAINNAVKYSQASNIIIQLVKKDDTTILLSVKDDGIGFVSSTNSGNGIANMKRRADELNGVFTILSNNKGTDVKFEMPII